MSIVNTLSLESNRQIKINFDGGDLSSDAGLLLIKEFVSKLGIDKLFSHSFKTNDSASFRYHTDKENLLQMIYMIIAGYFEDDASDELTNDPVFKAVLNKDALASQPTVSRFFNRMDEDTLNQFLTIGRILRKRVYSVQMPQDVILDLDSTLLNAYGKQEGRAFNFHYQSNGYHPLVCYDGLTGDLIKIQLRDGTQYSCTGVVDFLQPILDLNYSWISIRPNNCTMSSKIDSGSSNYSEIICQKGIKSLWQFLEELFSCQGSLIVAIPAVHTVC